MALCEVCNKPLNMSLRRKIGNVNFKSCPKCSSNNGEEHVFYEFPMCFGTTPLRATPNTPDGAQSYCVPCRGDQVSTNPKRLCSEFIK